MSVLVTDTGFAPDDWQAGFIRPETLATGVFAREVGLDIDADIALPALAEMTTDFDRIALIRIRFASFADGRGFTLARQLRLLGYLARLRASGHVIADQYAMARRSGFDEVEIDPALAERQPEDQWLARSEWRSGDYQGRLGMARAVGNGRAGGDAPNPNR